VEGGQSIVVEGEHSILHPLDPALHQRQGRPQLVGQILGELPTSLLLSLEVLGQAGQGVTEFAYLPRSGRRGHWRAPPGAESPGRAGEPLQREREAPGHEQPGGDRDQRGDPGSDQVCAIELGPQGLVGGQAPARPEGEQLELGHRLPAGRPDRQVGHASEVRAGGLQLRRIEQGPAVGDEAEVVTREHELVGEQVDGPVRPAPGLGIGGLCEADGALRRIVGTPLDVDVELMMQAEAREQRRHHHGQGGDPDEARDEPSPQPEGGKPPHTGSSRR
jgi:hypothetical protein